MQYYSRTAICPTINIHMPTAVNDATDMNNSIQWVQISIIIKTLFLDSEGQRFIVVKIENMNCHRREDCPVKWTTQRIHLPIMYCCSGHNLSHLKMHSLRVPIIFPEGNVWLKTFMTSNGEIKLPTNCKYNYITCTNIINLQSKI